MRCQFIKKNKKQCSAKAIRGEKHCFYHSSNKKDKRKEASALGGLNSRKNNIDLEQIEIKSPADIPLIVAETINLLRGGKVHPNYANSIYIGCNTFLKAFRESEDYKERMRLEDLLRI